MHAFLKSVSVACLIGSLGMVSPALATPSQHRLPVCTATHVLHAAMARIAAANADYRNGITVNSISHIAETGYSEPLGSPLAMRSCSGRATLSDGKQQAVYFRIAEGRGTLGQTWGVEACLPKLDKWYVYGIRCQVLQP